VTKQLPFFKNKKTIDLFFLFLICFLTRFIFLIFTDNKPGDPWERIIHSLEWLENPHFILSSYWLPLHTYLISGILLLWNNPLIAPRVLSLLFGSFTVIPLYLLLKHIFGRNNALFSCILFSLLGVHISYSAQSWSEAPALFFLITGFYFSLCEKRLNTLTSISAGLFIGLSSMIRIEFWVFIPLLIGLRILETGIKKSLVYSFSTLLFPCLWMISTFVQMGDILPYYSLNIASERYKIGGFWEKFFIYPVKFIKLVGPIIAIGSFFGICLSFLQRKGYELGVLFIGYLSFFIYESIKVNANAQSRFLMIIAIISFPYFFFFIQEVNFIKKEQTKKILILVGFISSILLSAWGIFFSGGELKAYRAPQWEITLSEKFAAVPKNEKILIDNYDWFISNIAVRSGISPKNFGRVFMSAPYVGIKSCNGFYSLNDNGLIRYLEKEKPSIFLYYPDGVLKEYFTREGNTISLKNLDYRFTFLYETGPYLVYKINYQE